MESRREYPEEHVWVGPTELGFGVMATRQFLPNEAIGRVHGTVVRDAEHGSDYCMELDEETGLELGEPFRYLNHSCQPNCQLSHFEAEEIDDVGVETEESSLGLPEIWIEAIAEINPGDQLTIDYGWPADTEVRCLCGSPRCRGWIGVSDDTSDRPIRVDGPEGAEPHLPPSEVHQLDASTEQPLSNPA